MGLSEKLEESFPNKIHAERPVVKPAGIKDANWLRGFVEAEGCFQIIIQESKDKRINSISLRFTLTQDYLDSLLLESFVDYLGCGRWYPISNRKEIYFIVSDIRDKIIPLFYEYPLIGTKKEDYLDFCKVVELINSKDHLTEEGLEKIKVIKSNMNSRRIHYTSLLPINEI